MNGRGFPADDGLAPLFAALERRAESKRVDALFHDPIATHVVAALLGAGGQAMQTVGRFRAVSSFLFGYLALRTWFFDNCVVAAARTGCAQVVLMGGAVDGRLFRAHWPVGTRIFVVDNPSMLALQQRTAAPIHQDPPQTANVPATGIHAVAPGLLDAGFILGAPAAWILEGLLPKVPDAETDRLLATITHLSAAGSKLCLDQFNHALRRETGRAVVAAGPAADPGVGSVVALSSARRTRDQAVHRILGQVPESGFRVGGHQRDDIFLFQAQRGGGHAAFPMLFGEMPGSAGLPERHDHGKQPSGSSSTMVRSSGRSQRCTENSPRNGFPSADARGLPCRIAASKAIRSRQASDRCRVASEVGRCRSRGKLLRISGNGLGW